MDDLLSEFLTETSESLAVLDVELVKLEQNPNDPELLGNIFRLVHTIKGTCGFLGLPRLEAVAHASENVLGRIRDNSILVTPYAVSLILASLDRIQLILSKLEETEAEPPGDDVELIAQLNGVAEGKAAPAAAAPKAEAPKIEAPKIEAPKIEAPKIEAPKIEAPKAEPPKPAVSPAPQPAPAAAKAQPPAPPAAAPAQAKPQTAVAAPAPTAADHGPDEAKESAIAASSIRVHVDVLENLMTMVSELVLTRNQLLQILRTQKDSEFGAPLQRLNHVTSELQEGVMKTRMQPIGNAWAKLPRLVRDLSLELGKKIDLQMYGADTELDRQVLDMIKDPLTHMVRNSGDHGLETPAERAAAGKPEVGRITLNAYHEGGHIIIEVSDDGRGLNVERIKQKILQQGLASAAEIEQMSDTQIYQYIFKAGFSTASKVTAVSGRGVGMDVVKTNVEKIGGTIDMKSQIGRGSTFNIKIPLTLAIVNALIVDCGGERFAIPQISVEELVRASAKSEHRIEKIKDTPVLRLRNRLLPLVSLKHLLKLDDGKDLMAETEHFIVVTQVGTYMFGIIVDRVYDTEEIVVKPVAPILRDITLFSGNTILGDGSVIMILDPNGIAAATGEMTIAHGHVQEQVKKEVKRDSTSSLLVFKAGDQTPKAVPLALVARLEEIAVKDVEYSNGKPIVQYRDQLMPLVTISKDIKIKAEGRTPVLVFQDRDHTMGLVVDEIVDIVEEKMTVQLAAEKQGQLGSAIIAGKATEVIDAGFYLTQAFDSWFNTDRDADQGRSRRVLLVDDSPFFRNLLTPMLAVAGYDVVTAESGAAALKMCEDGHDFDVIVSDIEMPQMNGFDFAAAVRAGTRWSKLPLVALSGYTSQRDIERARQVGFSDYVAKFDREGLIQTLAQTLSEQAPPQLQQRGAA